ncbi:F0F1 ATP synthase subunit epsilon [Isobaculum melis]|uniref:ATP synthase epsilon chain n=1 Tax=Isobaculum melis TaxID=142588 RepID=A0A1H9PW87_9LACT|nr:F0F1 ATP synthase subunit epsilon [Isobaculum melis]SER52432.1 F-type H+-transporting ATPase subunit epsilon [Isobaculum melis]
MSFMQVNIVTPDGIVFSHRAEMIVAKTLDGEIGILPKHAPIIVPLKIDEVRVERVGPENWNNAIAVNGGVMEVRDNVCNIIADSAERARDIDLSRAEKAKLRAEKRIESAKQVADSDELRRATVALHKAINRISVSGHRR